MSKHSDKFINEYNAFVARNIVLPAIISNNYEFVSCISETQNKALYLLRSKHLNKLFLLKSGNSQNGSSLAEEYKLLKTLAHPRITKAEFYFEQDDTQYLILDYFEGITLAQYVDENGPFNDADAVHILLQVCDMIGYLHSLKPPVIHRDIKPQNIIYGGDGCCKLIDFDIARRFRSQSQTDTEYLGTRCTAAPEQFGYMQTSPKTDIYALGILLLYLLTGSFETNQVSAVKNKTLARIVAKCIRFDPKNRFSSVSQLERSLKGTGFRKKNGIRIAIAALAICSVSVFIAAATPPPDNPISSVKKQPIQHTIQTQPPVSSTQPPKSTQSAEPSPTMTPLTSAEISELSEPVTLSSPLIERAVRLRLGLNTAGPITKGDLDKITRLYICGNDIYNNWNNVKVCSPCIFLNDKLTMEHGDITSLDDLKKFKNLKELALYNQNISDISVLKDLKLTKLGLGANNISDISPLADCKKLEALIINSNPISDITPLSSLTSLKQLDIGNTEVADFSVITGCPLEDLTVCNSPIQSFLPLSKLPGLKVLSASNLTLDDLQLCAELTKLERFTILNSELPSLSVLYPLKNLTFLCIMNSQLSDISGISQLTKLNGFDITDNPIEDISPLSGMKVTYLCIGHTHVTNFETLAELTSLTDFGCSHDQLDTIEKVLDGRPVRIGFVD